MSMVLLKMRCIPASASSTSSSDVITVTTIAAIRRGALQLAVGGIIGGNMFDVLFLSASDIAYRDGSIYGAIDASSRFWVLTAIIMTLILLLGLIRREKSGPGNIGFESVAVLSVYVVAAILAGTIL